MKYLISFIFFILSLCTENGAAIQNSSVAFQEARKTRTLNNLIPNQKNTHTVADSNVTLIGRWPYGPCTAVFVKDNVAYIGNGTVMNILDISDPASPVEIGRIETPDVVEDIFISRHHAYIANCYSGLSIIDVTNPASPVEVGFYDTGKYVGDVYVSGNLAYITTISNRLILDRILIINIQIPTRPRLIGYIQTDEVVRDIAVQVTTRRYLYVANSSNGLRVYDVTAPSNPVETGSIKTGGSACGLHVLDSYAYVVDLAGLHIIDISNPDSMVITGSYFSGYPQMCGVFITERYAFVTDRLYGGLWIFDVSERHQPSFKVFFHPGFGGSSDVYVAGRYAYVAHESAGLRVVDVDKPANPVEIAQFETGSYMNDIYVSEDYAYVTGGPGMVIFDVSAPESPKERGVCSIEGYVTSIYVKYPFAYLTGQNGLQIIDVSDPDRPSVAAFFRTLRDTWDVVVSNKHAYVACFSGLRIIDVNTPENPIEMALFEMDNKATGVSLYGCYAYVLEMNSGLHIIDVSVPSHPAEAGFLNTGNDSWEMYVLNNFAYIAGSSSGVHIYDVSLPPNSIEVGNYKKGHTNCLFVSNNYVYATEGTDGLMIIDVNRPASPVEAGSFDTSAGALSVFVSGKLAYVACGYGGLYVLRNDLITGTEETPIRNLLKQNYPNPFNGVTTIRFELPVPERVTLKLFDMSGREIDTVVNDILYNSGIHEIKLNSVKLTSGIYIYRMYAGVFVDTKKLVFLR